MENLDTPPKKDPEKEKRGTTRRDFLRMTGAAMLAAALPTTGPLVGIVASPEPSVDTTPADTLGTKGKGLKFHEIHPQRSKEEQEKFQAEKAHQSEHFSEDWKKEHWFTTPMGEKVRLYDMNPQEPKTSVPVAMWGGWTANAELWKKNMRELVSLGRRALTVDAAHGVDYSPDVQEHVDKATDKATHVEYRKVAAMMAGLDAAGAEKVDAIAHSEGCIDLLIAALAYPEHFRNIVLVEPAGMIGRDSFFAFAYRNQLEDAPAMRAAHDAQQRGVPGATFEKHPDDSFDVNTFSAAMKTPDDVLRSAEELLSIAWIQIADLLRAVKAKGISITVMSSPEDAMFPTKYMTGTPKRDAEGRVVFDEKGKPIMETKGTIGEQKRAGESDTSEILDGFISVKGVHTRFFDQPVEYTQLAEGVLTAREALERKAA